MKLKVHTIIAILGSGLFLFIIDQILKYFARTNPDFTYYLGTHLLGWEYFPNTGIAFSIPVPNLLVVIFTPIILFGIMFWYLKYCKQISDSRYQIAVVIILLGALSNFIDRLLFGMTIDYLRILTGVINLADVMIVGGVIMMIVKSYKVESYKV